MRLISLWMCTWLKNWTNYNVAVEHIYLSMAVCSNLPRTLKTVVGRRLILTQNWRLTAINSGYVRWSLREVGREWMTVAQRGQSDISTPTVCHSVLPVMYGWSMAAAIQQNWSILPCHGMLQRDNERLWPLLWNDKTPWGWGERKGASTAGGWFLKFNMTRSAVLQWHLND